MSRSAPRWCCTWQKRNQKRRAVSNHSAGNLACKTQLPGHHCETPVRTIHGELLLPNHRGTTSPRTSHHNNNNFRSTSLLPIRDGKTSLRITRCQISLHIMKNASSNLPLSSNKAKKQHLALSLKTHNGILYYHGNAHNEILHHHEKPHSGIRYHHEKLHGGILQCHGKCVMEFCIPMKKRIMKFDIIMKNAWRNIVLP